MINDNFLGSLFHLTDTVTSLKSQDEDVFTNNTKKSSKNFKITFIPLFCLLSIFCSSQLGVIEISNTVLKIELPKDRQIFSFFMEIVQWNSFIISQNTYCIYAGKNFQCDKLSRKLIFKIRVI